MRFVPEMDVRYSGIGEDDGEPSDLGEEDGEPIDLSAGSPHVTAQPGMLFLLSINSFGFSYGMTVSTLGLVILPSEAVYLYHDRHAVMLGVMLGCTGITQLICPAIGYTSDRSTSRYGRRRPTMVAGALIACLGHCAMLACHHYRIGHLYLVSLTVAVFGMNCCYACYTALLPDFVLPEHMGKASGVMASITILGSFLGFALFGFYLDVEHSYPLYCAAVLATNPNPSPNPSPNPNPNPNPKPDPNPNPNQAGICEGKNVVVVGGGKSSRSWLKMPG